MRVGELEISWMSRIVASNVNNLNADLLHEALYIKVKLDQKHIKTE